MTYIVAGTLMAGHLSSCSSDFLKEYSQDLSRVQSSDDLNELLLGSCCLPLSLVANELSSFQRYNDNYVWLHFLPDEIVENPNLDYYSCYMGLQTEVYPITTWQKNLYVDYQGKVTQEGLENKMWAQAYECINNCNMVIEAADGLAPVSDDDAKTIERIKGEAYYLRASYYLTLANLYGKPYTPATAATDLAVPVKTSPNVEDKEYQRASVAEVYEQIIADMNQAEQLLNGNAENLGIYHVSIEAVYILRSRIALYMQDWQTAADYARKAIDHNGYLLDLGTVSTDTYPISKANAEVVYSNGASNLGNFLYPHPQDDYDVPMFIVSDDLYNLFDVEDYRRTRYVTTDDDLINHSPLYHKIDNRTSSLGKYKEVSDMFSIRTAEAYLNMAEAKAELGQDAEACQWLDQLRDKRVENNEHVSLTGADLMSFIRDERERELCFEGHRWFDLRRYMVDTRYPFSKEIVHPFSYYSNYRFDKRVYYRLEKNDPAYVLDIPKRVRDFQPSIGSNVRVDRLPFKTETEED